MHKHLKKKTFCGNKYFEIVLSMYEFNSVYPQFV